MAMFNTPQVPIQEPMYINGQCSLPDRQLRKRDIYELVANNGSLPDRQLRNVKAISRHPMAAFTAG